MGFYENTLAVKAGMLFFLLLGAAIFSIRYGAGKGSVKETCRWIIFMGCVMRIGYLLYTPCTMRGHDLWELTLEACGKAGYVLQIAVNGQLPPGYELQYYQQPLFFILGGLWAKGVNVLLTLRGQSDFLVLADVSRWVACAASCLILPVASRLFDLFEIRDYGKCFGMMLVSFSPVFYLMGGWIGEDSLLVLFMALALLVTGYYEKQPSYKNIILLALIYGFGMMTKISMAVPALYTSYVFGKMLWKEMHKGKLLKQFALFAVISLPLGLWFNVRNLILYGQPLFYVLKQDVEGSLYTGGSSYIARFFLPDIGNLLRTPYANPLDDYNLVSYLLKSELFGEFTYQVPAWIPVILLFLHVMINLCIIWYLIKIWRKRERWEYSRKLLIWYAGILVFSAFSYLTNPFGCTMDYRYYAVLSVVKGLLWGQFLEQREEKKSWFSRIGVSLPAFWKTVTVLFSGFSMLMYLMV